MAPEWTPLHNVRTGLSRIGDTLDEGTTDAEEQARATAAGLHGVPVERVEAAAIKATRT